MQTRVSLSFALPFLLLTSLPSHAADVPVTQDTSTTPSGEVTAGAGKLTSLAVQPTKDALLRFDLASLPASYDANTLQSARLRLYVSKVSAPGDVSIHLVTQDWSESADGPAPTFDVAPIATIPSASVPAKGFLVVDLTSTARAWLQDASTNFGVAVVADGATPTAKLALAAKEGPKNGPAAELEMEAAIPAGSNNTNGSGTSVILGGQDHTIDATADFAVIPGGQSNDIGPNADFSFAAGRRARALHQGSFVWADSTNADFSSTMDNQFSIRAANGLFIANDAGGAKSVPVGTRYRDNAIVAWARVTAVGGLDSNFNVASVTREAAGVYTIVLNSSLSSGFSLINFVTPEIDSPVPPTPPVGAANVRFAAVDNVAAGNTFRVYMYDGLFASVDNDFTILVTGR